MNNQLKIAYSNLCNKDPRHPDYYDFYGQDIEEDIADGYTPEIPTPRKDCYCDNCFNGRDSLALIIIDLIEPKRSFKVRYCEKGHQIAGIENVNFDGNCNCGAKIL